jgi:hypothetical protein
MYIIHQTDKIVAIATKSKGNRKTGKSVQVWILDSTMHPVESRKSGHDAKNQCAGCVFASGSGCYVYNNPLISIFNAWKRGSYKPLAMGSEQWEEFFATDFVRFGAYGNPSLLPLPMVEDIAKRARKITGYFHDWHMMKEDDAKSYGRFFMASCEASNFKKAQALGLRTFSVVPSPMPEAGIECLADAKGITCKECGLCDGNRRTILRNKPLPHIFITAHGYQKQKAIASSEGSN